MTSTSNEANETCHLLYSNKSNLIQIGNTMELFYAGHILMRNNISALMIEIDRQFLNGNNKHFLKRIYDSHCLERNSRYLLLGRELKRMRNHFLRDQMKYHRLRKNLLDELDSIIFRMSKGSINFRSFLEKANETFTPHHFEQMENIDKICNEIAWNVLDSNSTVYLLRVSSISTIEPSVH